MLHLYEADFAKAVKIEGTNDDQSALLFYSEGVVRWRHSCLEWDDEDRNEHVLKVIAPALAPAHTIAVRDETLVTITPSLHCPDCGAHGFIEESRWRAS